MNIKYRPEIDGLRTIAVLSVIIYHAEFMVGGHKLLPGGFLGVDIFFVISGFLITSLMMKEFHKTGTISISNFYERRAKRLLPALLIVMLISLPFAYTYLFPEQLVDYAKSLISSLLFGSNFYWNYSLQQYGAESALLKPFLHTWSLAVEEQYYIVFPLILLAIYKWCRSHTIALFTVGLLISLQFAEWITPIDASFSFYMLPSRIWELLAGGLIANILHLHPQKENDALLNKTMPVLGLYLILHSVIFTEFDAKHPGFITLMPVIGTMLIIWFSSKDELITKILSSKFFVGVGLISYSLYLWHYPIFSFGRIIEQDFTTVSKLAWIVLTIVLSLVSFYLIEKPFRGMIKLKLMASVLLGVIFFIGVVCSYFILNDGVPKRFSYNQNLMSTFERPSFESECKVKPDKELIDSAFCKIGAAEKPTFLLFGDSHALSLLNLLDEIGDEQGIGGRFVYMSGCPPVFGVYPKNGGKGKRAQCFELNQKVENYIRDNNIENVFLVARWDYYVNPSSLRPISRVISPKSWSAEESRDVLSGQLTYTLSEIQRAGAKPIILLQVPHQKSNPKGVYQRMLDKWIDEPKKLPEKLESWINRLSISVHEHKKRQSVANSIIRKASVSTNTVIVDPIEIFCVEKCLIGTIWGSYYYNVDHLSTFGSKQLKSRFLPLLD